MKKQKKLLSIFLALVIGVTASISQIPEIGTNTVTTASAAQKASMSNVLSLYKKGNYQKAQTMANKLSKNASEKCVKKMSKKMKKAYLKKVKKYKLFSKRTSYEQEYIWGYYLTDITNNGKADLIIQHGTCEADCQFTIYKYSKGKVVKIGSTPGGHSALYAYPNHKGIIRIEAHMGCESIDKIYVNKKSKIKCANYGSRQVADSDGYIDLPYLLDNHVPSGKCDVSYKALK